MFDRPDESWKFMTWNSRPDGKGAALPAGSDVKSVDRDLDLYAIWGHAPKIGEVTEPAPFSFGETIPFELPDIISVNDPEVTGYLEISETGEEYSGDDPYVSMAFSFFSAAIRRSEEKYERRRKANQENANQRWHGDDYDQENDHANDANRIDGMPDVQTETTKQSETEPIEANRKPNRNKAVFVPPTIAEVAAYCRERGNRIDPETFVSYYQRQGWVLSNGRTMKDWRSAVITWEKNGKEAGRGGLRGGRPEDHVRGQRDQYEDG